MNYHKLYLKKRFWAAVLVVQFLLFFIFSKIPAAVLFFENLFEIQKYIHQKIFSWLPFSVGDIFYILLGIALLILIFKSFKEKSKSKARLHILFLLNIIYFIYQIFWGMLYFQIPLSKKMPEAEVTIEMRKTLAAKYLDKCKILRMQVSEDKNGVFKIENLEKIKQEIILQQKYLPKNLNSKKPTLINSIKPSLYGKVMNFSGILGYYNPFTAEAQYNREIPSSYLPFTIAHESAHQLGYAREQEANFIGFLLGSSSADLEIQYSTAYFTLKSLLSSLVEDDPKFVRKMLAEYSSGMKRDRKAEKDFAENHRGLLDDFFGFTNNLFLKTNQQEGAVTYSYFVNLLVQYEMSKK
ncbi:hypothetical protein ASG01_07160 [Chryseobacterium sp. Leaf180]|nr:hypothetical protein ASG01_07160 [Chryseobacterium sp. Leaf180]